MLRAVDYKNAVDWIEAIECSYKSETLLSPTFNSIFFNPFIVFYNFRKLPRGIHICAFDDSHLLAMPILFAYMPFVLQSCEKFNLKKKKKILKSITCHAFLSSALWHAHIHKSSAFIQCCESACACIMYSMCKTHIGFTLWKKQFPPVCKSKRPKTISPLVRGQRNDWWQIGREHCSTEP